MTQDNRNRPTQHAVNAHDVTFGQISETIEELGYPKFRSKQINDWIWSKNITNYDEMTNLPKQLRENLSQALPLSAPTEVACAHSQDGSRKYLLAFADGVSVECVGMPSKNHLSVCISTQAGCGMKCAFCATGASGLTRSLTAGEMYSQVMHIRDDFNMRVSSVVFMGQGEPFANYDATLKALRLLNAKDKADIGARHLTVSTCGVIPNIIRFAKEPEQFTLAVSLHSANQSTRNALMPGVKRYSLMHLYEAMGTYVSLTGRRPSYEYALIKGVNDTRDELDALVSFCMDTLCHVNLIQLNEVSGSRFEPADPETANLFMRELKSVGVETTIRRSRGADIDAACGQLKQRFS